MSEEHKLKMKTAREKKQKEKRESMIILKQEKDLLRIKKVKEVTLLKEEVENDVKPQSKQSPNINIEDAVLEGIAKYEIVRKKRKAEKRQQKDEDLAKQKIKDTLIRAINPRGHNNNNNNNNMFYGYY